MKKKAFTLIELLVVISIIALLVSILLPSLRRAKLLAMDTVCSSNQRGVAMMFAMYTQEYNGSYPYAATTAAIFPHTWDEIVALALGHSRPYKMYDCPRSSEEIVANAAASALLSTAGRRAYSYNYYLGSQIGGSPNHGKPLTVENVRMPATTLLVTDSGLYCCGSGGSYWTISQPEEVFFSRHEGTVSVVFADSHIDKVDYVGPEEINQDYMP